MDGGKWGADFMGNIAHKNRFRAVSAVSYLHGFFKIGLTALDTLNGTKELRIEDAWHEEEALVRGFIGLGNQWQFKHFSLGAEWVNLGYGYRIGNVTSDLPVDASGKPVSDASSDFGTNPGFITVGARMTLGFAF